MKFQSLFSGKKKKKKKNSNYLLFVELDQEVVKVKQMCIFCLYVDRKYPDQPAQLCRLIWVFPVLVQNHWIW